MRFAWVCFLIRQLPLTLSQYYGFHSQYHNDTSAWMNGTNIDLVSQRFGSDTCFKGLFCGVECLKAASSDITLQKTVCNSRMGHFLFNIYFVTAFFSWSDITDTVLNNQIIVLDDIEP